MNNCDGVKTFVHSRVTLLIQHSILAVRPGTTFTDMFWVFCNSCYVKPSQSSKRNFFMTSCSHIFCDRCVRPEDGVCKRCQSNCLMVQCNSEMPEDVKEVFMDTNDNPSNLIKALEFQDFHRKRLMSHYKTIEQKYTNCKLMINNLQSNMVNMEQRCRSLEQALKRKEETIKQLSRKINWHDQRSDILQTPESTPQSSLSRPISSQPNFEVFSSQKSSHTQQNNPPKSTPRGNFLMYRKGTPAFTPKSGGSNASLSSSKFSTPHNVGKGTGDKKRLINGPVGFTPPANALALLSLLNRSRNHRK